LPTPESPTMMILKQKFVSSASFTLPFPPWTQQERVIHSMKCGKIPSDSSTPKHSWPIRTVLERGGLSRDISRL
jgi:hypothetical protein